jgi:hypothetical protein
MAIPSSAAKLLKRKEDTARRRRAALQAALWQVEAEIAEIENAKVTLSQSVNGKKPKLPKILGNVKVTKKDRVLSALRSRPQRGMTRREIADYIQQHGWNVPITSITSYLYLLREDSLANFDGRVWRPTKVEER